MRSPTRARAAGACCRPSSRTAFAQDSASAASTQWRKVADQLRPKPPKLSAFMDEAEEDGLADIGLPAEHWAELYSTNGLERLNGEIKRRTEMSASFPTRRPSCVSPALSCSNRTTYGPSNAGAT